MSHKITLTGTPKTGLRRVKNGKIYAFEMEGRGSDNPPKGLPKSGNIIYTVFVNIRQIRKAGLEKANIKDYKLLVQGEPTLDMSTKNCPGEIGIIAFKIEILPQEEKQEKEVAVSTDTENQENRAPLKTLDKLLPIGTDEYIPISKIKIPAEFEEKRPSQKKLENVKEYYREKGCFDKPISIRKEDYMLVDGYTRYVVAKDINMDTVPVKYV